MPSTPLVLLLGLTVAFVLWAIPTWWRRYDRLSIRIAPSHDAGNYNTRVDHTVSVQLRHRGEILDYIRVDLSLHNHSDKLAEALAKMQEKRATVAATMRAAAK